MDEWNELRVEMLLSTEMLDHEFTVHGQGVSIHIDHRDGEETRDTMLSYVRWAMKVLGYECSEEVGGLVGNFVTVNFIFEKGLTLA